HHPGRHAVPAADAGRQALGGSRRQGGGGLGARDGDRPAHGAAARAAARPAPGAPPGLRRPGQGAGHPSRAAAGPRPAGGAGGSGEVILDAVKTVEGGLAPEFKEFLAWADRYRTLGVRANADTPEDAQKAREFGAEGIGLVRTEHMFFAADRIPIVREMIMAAETITRRGAVQKLLPFQRDDFIGIFRAM